MTWSDGTPFIDKLVGWKIHTGSLITNANGLAFEKEVNEDKFSIGINGGVKFVPICQNADPTGKTFSLDITKD